MTDVPVPGSFRDPSGHVFRRDGAVLRRVNPTYAAAYDHLVSSGLREALLAEGLLLPFEEVPADPDRDAGAYRLLRPSALDFVSYPYEWCPGQLRDAATATLRIQALALDFGMSLRDASAYNIQFVDGRPVLIDTLSFEVLEPGVPWTAYRQFCQHFLAPLALATMVDVRLLQLARIHLDGVPLELASALLPARTRLAPGLALHLHSHARSQRRHASSGAGRDNVRGRFSLQAFRGLVDNLAGTVRRLTWNPPDSTWSAYYRRQASYSDASLQSKQDLVAKFLADLAPATVFDLGANTGQFSRLAAAAGARVVALESDVASVEASYRQAKADADPAVLPLVMDLTNPSPAQGWGHAERESLAQRGPADVVLALALIHHLAVGNNVPLPMVAAYLATLGRAVVVEFVPKGDAMVATLLASREDVFDGYHQAGFETAVAPLFDIDRSELVAGSERTLYLLRRR